VPRSFCWSLRFRMNTVFVSKLWGVFNSCKCHLKSFPIDAGLTPRHSTFNVGWNCCLAHSKTTMRTIYSSIYDHQSDTNWKQSLLHITVELNRSVHQKPTYVLSLNLLKVFHQGCKLTSCIYSESRWNYTVVCLYCNTSGAPVFSFGSFNWMRYL
jgi:hypothetical protein